MQITNSASSANYTAAAAAVYAKSSNGAASGQGGGEQGQGATIVTVSDAARAALAATETTSETITFAEVVTQSRVRLNELLDEAGRSSPMKDGRLALDMSSLGQRDLYAISTTDDGLFTSDERTAAGLELSRRFALALSGPSGVSEVTGDYRVVYNAAADYLDSQSAEQKAEADWIAAREAVAKAIKSLAADPSTPPAGIMDDPVADYLAFLDQADDDATDTGSLAENLRQALDKRYREVEQAGLNPTFQKSTGSGGYIDLSGYDARAVSAMALNQESLFSASEVRAASAEIKARGRAALSAAYKDAGESGDPTAFSRNIVSLFSSMSAAERQAAGWSNSLYDAAIANYETSAKLLSMLSNAGSAGSQTGWFSS